MPGEHEPHASNEEVAIGRGRTLALIVSLVGVLSLAGCSLINHHDSGPTARPTSASAPAHGAPNEATAAEQQLLSQVGDSLIALHQESDGGWRFESQIQAPHFQTDRDVGAASIGMGFLVLADRYPEDPKWLSAARRTADWLTAIETKHDDGTISWPDYVDPGDRATSTYTSFDDGTLGIGDFFWRLYVKTGDATYKNTAISAVNWTLAQAENVGTSSQPAYRWIWDTSTRNNPQNSDNPPVYNMGMGMGVTGIVVGLASFVDQTKQSDPAFAARCTDYINGALRYIQQTQGTLAANGGDSRALPETGVMGQDGDTVEDSGYLSGAAGTAFMYLRLYQVYGNQDYLKQANQLFGWLQDTKHGPMVIQPDGTTAWHIAIDPEDPGDPANTPFATGIEEGGAGIGWTYLQAYNLTGNKAYLTVAEHSAGWLMDVAIKDSQGGWSWPEDEHPTSSLIRPNLDNGASGIGMFFYDLYVATRDSRYLTVARGAAQWLMDTTKVRGKQVSWTDNDEGTPFSNEPSWHWGDAGVIAFLTRLSGGPDDIPGEQSGLSR